LGNRRSGTREFVLEEAADRTVAVIEMGCDADREKQDAIKIGAVAGRRP
jgi:hypothetical protein